MVSARLRRRLRSAGASAALLVACGGGGPKLPPGDPGRPDIVLVSIDTLRADHLHAYGNPRETSPFIDRLAAEGARFAAARSASPWTLPAHTTLLSGQLPSTHLVVDDNLRLDPEVPVLPELLGAAGYARGGFVATLYVSRIFGFERGFDHFEDFGLHTERANLAGEVLAEDVVDAALAWWSKQPPGQPVFLFLHSYDVHYEYDPPGLYSLRFDRPPLPSDPKYKNYHHFKKQPLDEAALEHQRAQYDEAIRYVDDQLARLAEQAAAAGRSVRFVITSDHGEEFGERGSWGHAHTLYAEQLHVPLILSGPGLSPGVHTGAVGTHDIAPTIAAWVGAEGALRADGLDLLAEEAPAAERPFLAETTRFKTARLGLLEGGRRLEWDLRQNSAQMFNVNDDPAERLDQAAAEPAAVAALQAGVEQALGAPWLAEVDGLVTTEGGVILAGGHRGARHRVAAGERFVVIPFDAPVSFERLGQRVGPFQAAGGARPGADACLRYLSTQAAGAGSLSEAQRERLVALGYMQPEDKPTDAILAPPPSTTAAACAPPSPSPQGPP